MSDPTTPLPFQPTTMTTAQLAAVSYLARYRRRLDERIAAGTAEIVRGDAGALPWPEGSFTVLTCMQVFEMFSDPQRVLAEVLRVLRPSGRAVLNIGERVDPGTQTHRTLGEFWVWAVEDVRRMVEQAGFTDVTTQYVAWGGDNPVEKLFGRLVGPIGGISGLLAGSRRRPALLGAQREAQPEVDVPRGG